MTATLALCVLAKSQDELADFLRAHEASGALREANELGLIVNDGARYGGLGTVGNRWLGFARSTVVAIVHADTVFEPGALTVFRDAAERHHALTGIVGRRPGRNVWCHSVVAPYANGVEVFTLDGCSVFVPSVLRSIRFDDVTFDNFHCCVEDLCLQARAMGHRSIVPRTTASHRGMINRPNDWLDRYWVYRRQLDIKWKQRFPDFQTT